MGSNYGRLRPEVTCELQNETGYTDHQIKTLYKHFTENYPQGYIYLSQFKDFCKILFKENTIQEFCFNTLSSQRDGGTEAWMDFRGFLRAIHVIDQATVRQRLEWAFDVMDLEEDGAIPDDKALQIIDAIHSVVLETNHNMLLPSAGTTLNNIKTSTGTDTSTCEREAFVNGAMQVSYLVDLLQSDNLVNQEQENPGETSGQSETSFNCVTETEDGNQSRSHGGNQMRSGQCEEGAVGGQIANTLAVDAKMCAQAERYYAKHLHQAGTLA